MLRDIDITLTDGALGAASNATGVHAKIGVSSVTTPGSIVIKGSMNPRRIRELLGHCPLADACLDSIDAGAATIYCLPVAASTQGTCSEVTAAAGNAGSGTMTVTGNPTNAYQIAVSITRDGALNEAAARVSLDAGVSWLEERTLPISGALVLEGTGLTLTMAPGDTGFAAGDGFRFSTTAPAASNADILAAVDRLRRVNATIEFAHIVGASDKGLWASCAAEAERYHSVYRKPLFFIFEAAAPAEGQDAGEYAAARIAERREVNSKYIQVSPAYGSYTRMDGSAHRVNLAGLFCGLYARAKVQQSIGETAAFSLSGVKLAELLPIGIEDYIDTLDEAGYITVRRYEGLSGWYVTNARMMVTPDSDYQYAERVRVTNKIVRVVRTQLLRNLQTQVNIGRLDTELAALTENAMIPLDAMRDATEISSARVIIPEGQDILATETLRLIIRYVPVGHVRAIEVDLGMENPYAAK